MQDRRNNCISAFPASWLEMISAVQSVVGSSAIQEPTVGLGFEYLYELYQKW